MKKVHFVGIGGIGMSALAQYFLDQGAQVTGSDREVSPVTQLLEEKGIRVMIPQVGDNMPSEAETVIYSEAVPISNPERVRAGELGINQLSYFQMLGEVSQGKKTIAVAGTHGKTTTSGMLAKILIDTGASPTVIVGSLMKDFGSNYVSGDSNLFVVEACEYKRDFLTLSPTVLVITNIEWDHTDYYADVDDYRSAFWQFAEKVPREGAIITKPEDPAISPILQGLVPTIVDYTQEPSTKSDLVLGKPAYELLLPGAFNQMNARAAAAAARIILPEITDVRIAESLASFQGTWRRFEYKGKTKSGAEVYDDYAHHPTAVRETLKAAREKTKGKLYVAFHPHLYSRTKDLFKEFAAAFTDANEVLVAPIYAAREKDDGTVSSEMLAEAIAGQGIHARAASFEEIEHILRTEPKAGDVIISMGAGDIYKVADKLVQESRD